MKSLLRLLSSFGVMVSLLAALSLAAAGGTHRIANMDTARAAFMQAFGQEAEICGEVGGKSSVSPDCPMCHLVSAVVLPDPVQSPEGIELRFVAQVVLPQAQRAADTPFDPAHAMRGPPLV